MKDFERFSILGFYDSLWVVPPFYVAKEDQVDQEEVGGVDFSDKKAVN